jgi:hypothetical protein
MDTESIPEKRDRRRGLKKPLIFVIGIVVGVSLLYWRYSINIPLWLVRATAADRSDIYLGKTNGIPNRALVQSARGYLHDIPQSQLANKLLSSAQFESLGIQLDAAWFARHRPDSVTYDPFAPETRGNFIVTWIYHPGCQRVLGKTSFRGVADWFDLKGSPCYGGYAVSIYMAPNLRLTDIKIDALAGK